MKILVASSISSDALEALSRDHELVMVVGGTEDELAEAITDCDALIFRSGVQISEKVLTAATGLSLIVRAGSGYDNIDLAPVRRGGIRFVRIPGPGAKAVAELSFSLMLTLARQLLWADSQWRQGHWVKPKARGRLLTGRVLGIVGAGNIGTRVGALGAAWGMDVLGCVEWPSESEEERLARHGITLTDIDSVLSKSDFVSVHVTLQESTLGLIGEREIALMKPDAFLVNLARGGVVDEAALRSALIDGRLAGAALDVHAVEGEGKRSPLADLPNVVLTPHIGASTVDTQREIGEVILRVIEEATINPPELVPDSEDFHVLSA